MFETLDVVPKFRLDLLGFPALLPEFFVMMLVSVFAESGFFDRFLTVGSSLFLAVSSVHSASRSI